LAAAAFLSAGFLAGFAAAFFTVAFLSAAFCTAAFFFAGALRLAFAAAFFTALTAFLTAVFSVRPRAEGAAASLFFLLAIVKEV